MEPTDQEIYRLLYRLGITANYAGFFHLAHALRLCAEKPDRLLLVTKLVYPEVAKASEYPDCDRRRLGAGAAGMGGAGGQTAVPQALHRPAAGPFDLCPAFAAQHSADAKNRARRMIGGHGLDRVLRASLSPRVCADGP